MDPLEGTIDRAADETSFSGVVLVDRDGDTEFAKAYGLADRAHEIANTVDTRFGTASCTKGFTALTVMSLVEEGALTLTTTARSVLGEDLPLIDEGVTVEHLLSHRSGIGDYLDEEATDDITDYVMPVPVQQLATTEDFVKVLGGFETVAPPGERFAYCNGGFVVLALIAERTSGVPFHDLVRQCVLDPAGMERTEFLRSDELPGDAAIGYLGTESPRTNVLHLPVRGTGDGGTYSPAADLSAFWTALWAGSIVSTATVADMVRSRSTGDDGDRYGLGFWLHPTSDVVWLAGYDAGVSFRSTHDPSSSLTHTVMSNTSEGAWPITKVLDEQLGT